MRKLRIAMAQINPTVGDLEGNTRKIIRYIDDARSAGADLITFPELAVTGYPPEDLLFKTDFVRANLHSLENIMGHAAGITAIVGFVDSNDDIFNAAAIIHDGALKRVYHKMYLPNYGVFDEDRYFQAGSRYPIFRLNDVTFGVNICEDIWYPGGPTLVQGMVGAELILNISSSPYHSGKRAFRMEMIATRARDNLAIVAFNNCVGGQDELTFDGNSVIFDQEGVPIAVGREFEEDLIIADLNIDSVAGLRLRDPRRRKEKRNFDHQAHQVEMVNLGPSKAPEAKPPLPKRGIPAPSGGDVEEIFKALVLGTRDYVRKNGFQRVVVGLSGGVDSALTAAIAVKALGKENVVTVSMPSRYTSKASVTDAEALSKNLGTSLLNIPITNTFKSYLTMMDPTFEGREPDIAEENIQARIRGNILMAISNKFGWLVLTTGNKSETSVGYCTIYGDMAGGFAVIKDVYKTMVYRLCEYINASERREVIPRSILTKAPSAELKPNQKDEDSLPPYPLLDAILHEYVERDKSFEEIVSMGYAKEVVQKVINLVDLNEYKRRQAPPGIKITPKAFGKDRRLPITNKYRSYLANNG